MSHPFAALPHVPLAALPTPLQPARRLSEAAGNSIWFKRDDLTGFGLGGNKVRALEYLAADAVRQGADTLVTAGGAQSNHVRATMAAAAHLGMKGVALFHGSRPAETQGNLLVDHLLGAALLFTDDPDRTRLDAYLAAEADRLRAAGRRPYVIGRGGASPLGCVGYVAATVEIEDQCEALGLKPDYLVCATGSCCTQAGLLVGAKWRQVPYRVYGFTVSRPREECIARIRYLATETASLLGLDLSFTPDDIHVNDQFIGDGYGLATPAGLDAIRQVAQAEGHVLDPVYTGKAMAGLFDLLEKGHLGADPTVLFLHTGGSPSLFAYASDLFEAP